MMYFDDMKNAVTSSKNLIYVLHHPQVHEKNNEREEQ
jgi:hypothetical protein